MTRTARIRRVTACLAVVADDSATRRVGKLIRAVAVAERPAPSVQEVRS